MRALTALAFAGLIGCARPPARTDAPPRRAGEPAPSPSLEELLRRDLAAHDGVPWSAARRLTWGDFRAAPPSAGPEAARTGYGIYYAWRCRGRAFEFRVIAAFHPRESWVKPGVVRDSAESRRALAHEQTHFDISEVYARRLRRHFGALADPCGRSDTDLEALARRLVQEGKATQRRYDAETGHGLRPREQAAWEAEIGRALKPTDPLSP